MVAKNCLAALLQIKACDLRADMLYQCETSVDRGIHIGGAYSALPALTALYYGGGMTIDVENPTSPAQDIFVLSKGHSIAALASVYADLGYIDREDLHGSRGVSSRIKGHPGPLIPGVAVATGPLGHGISISCGFAYARLKYTPYRAYCLVGDGELQEGSNWEGLMYAATHGLRNLCVIIDSNNGQSDSTSQLVMDMSWVGPALEAMGFRVLQAYADHMVSLLTALETFRSEQTDDRPTAIVMHGSKGIGGYGSVTGKHKATLNDELLANERFFLQEERTAYLRSLAALSDGNLDAEAARLGYHTVYEKGILTDLVRMPVKRRVKRAAPRDKRLRYDADALPRFTIGQEASTSDVLTACARVLAHDSRFYTIDSDLSNASGLYDGTRQTNAAHALNVGIAECNMMCLSEALAAEGCNVWNSTFTPFFDLQAFRRIAVSYQERQSEIDAPDGWLSQGHNLDITFLGTSSNLETAVNGATHMGNDDICIYGQLAHVRVIDTSCPQQLVAVVRWLAEGDRGLIYLRTLRGKAQVRYPADFRFEYGKGYELVDTKNARIAIITSGRGVEEAVKASELLAKDGVKVGVVDMPSLDMSLLRGLLAQGCPLYFAEQNNGALFDAFSRKALETELQVDPRLVLQSSTRDAQGQAQFISSGTYEQLTRALGLNAEALVQSINHYLERKDA